MILATGSRPLRSLSTWLLCAAAAGCGGGGGSAGDSGGGVVPGATLALNGTAATGAAIAGGGVQAKCATGTGTATTGADGTFSMTITGGALPCVVRVTAGAVVLHSLATGAGASARVNVTPVTELVVARLAGDLPATFFNGFSSATTGILGASAATAEVVASLRSAGVDPSGSGDVLSGPLVAANGSVAGNSYDVSLDVLRALLAARGTSLAEITQATALGSPNAPVANRSTVASLPTDLLLATAATNCPSLRSGKYRIVVNQDNGNTPATQQLTVSATGLTIVEESGLVTPLTATGPCLFSNPSGGEVAVSRAGVAAARVPGIGGILRGAFILPEQAHVVAELAGDWNFNAYERAAGSGTAHLTSGNVTIDGVGRFTALNLCDDVRNCIATSGAALPAITLAINAAGGFDLTNATSGVTARLFAYRAGGGEMMLVTIAASGNIAFYTRKTPTASPAVGSTRDFRNLYLEPAYYANLPVSLSRSTTLSIDATAGTYVRSAVQNFNTGVSRPETFQINTPREGYVRRVPATRRRATARPRTWSSSSASPCAAWTSRSRRWSRPTSC